MNIRATYRLQLDRRFPFAAVRALATYLQRLGLSHCYLSPILQARANSAHGYDGVDPTRVSRELGGERGFRTLARALRRRGLGVVLDIVPNHLAASDQNPFWEDVLARGTASRYSTWFDVDWSARGRGSLPRVFLPVLGRRLPAAIARGEIRVERRAGRYRVRYYDQSFPLAPETIPLAGEGPARLRELLARQHYQLAYWRRAAREINYRRFFTISHLVALRMEDPAAFDATHRLVLRLVADGLVQGLRIDHVDGLLDPRRYLERLAAAAGRGRCALYVEKILARDEPLRPEWPVAGTTGYDFLAQVEDLYIEPAGLEQIERAYRAFTGRRGSFADAAAAAKRKMLVRHLSADVHRLARRLKAGVGGGPSPRRRRVAVRDLAAAIRETLVHLPVYRTYLDGRRPYAADQALLRGATAAARAHRRVPGAAMDALEAALAGPDLGFVQRFQQLAVPAAAKGVEDTAFYRYVPLVSRNEVGADPGAPVAAAVATLHAANRRRAAQWPAAMLAVSTHDSKRSADVRARLDVLSEVPHEWAAAVRRWHRWNGQFRGRPDGRVAPEPNAEYLLYQTLVGVWPLSRRAPGPRALASLRARVGEYMLKAVREAKQRTSWIEPDLRYEAALRRFVEAVLAPRRSARFLADLGALVVSIGRAGLWNSLSRTLVHLTAPGTPDVYQGDELWNFSLVDPDSRRPVDWARRVRALRQLDRVTRNRPGRWSSAFEAMVRAPEDGRIKLYLVRAALAARRRHARLFAGGAYLPLRARGPGASSIFAFARRDRSQLAVVVAPRLTRPLVSGPSAPPVGEAWRGTDVLLPAPVPARLRSLLSGGTVLVQGAGGMGVLPVSEALARFPGALLVG